MKKKLIRILCLCLLVLPVIGCFAGCDNGSSATYRNDVKVDTIATALIELLPTQDGYYSPDSDYLEFNFDGAAEHIEEYVIDISATSTNINQFGIFKAREGEAETVKALCDKYIATMTDRWVAQASYIAAEHPKMENAEARIFGNYVVYVMLTAADKAEAFAAVESLLGE